MNIVTNASNTKNPPNENRTDHIDRVRSSVCLFGRMLKKTKTNIDSSPKPNNDRPTKSTAFILLPK